MADDILIVDDEKDIRSLLSMTLEDEGYTTLQAANADEARTALLAQPPKLAIFDIWMRDSDMDGIELLEWVKSIYPSLPVLMISGHGTIETAVQAIRLGAYDFIEKPFKEARLLMMVERALDNARLARENIELRARIDDGETPELIGNSAVMRTIRQSIEKIAPTASRVLINGPSGSGKELAARTIHSQSDRRQERFVVANCARLSTERVDAELFGAESLQSHRRVVGLFEQAHRGTLYFDEICDFHWKRKARLCAPSMNSGFGVLAAIARLWLMCGLFRHQAVICRRRLALVVFAKIYITGLAWCRYQCHHLPIGARIFRFWRNISPIALPNMLG